ncbi:MAG: serine/threonine protein phosphatase, partial [bacterium]
YQWFSDEQPSEATKAYVEQQLEKNDWTVDVVLSHTVPYKYRPVDLFIKSLDIHSKTASTSQMKSACTDWKSTGNWMVRKAWKKGRE